MLLNERKTLKQNWKIISTNDSPKIIEYTPLEFHDQMKSLFPSDVEFSVQSGENIGSRMSYAFQKAFKSDIDQIILLGSDLADLRKKDIDIAFEQLIENDVVIGPSTDGGYYLIGFNRNTFNKELFDKINWSTDQVFYQTLNKIRESQLSLYILPERNDIDTFDDIKLFLSENKKSSEFRKALTYIVFGDRK